MFSIKNLHAKVGDVPVLNGINLEVKQGEVHAIMGPNGAGKSTLSKVVAGHPSYEVVKGSITYQVGFEKVDVLSLEPEDRAKQGIFISYQYPLEVPGLQNTEFLRAAFNSICEAQGAEMLDPADFEIFVKKKVAMLGIKADLLNRDLNVDFSGGEKKRNEILQMAILTPRIAFLDETDSGLDIDALKTVSESINKLKSKDNALVLVTHYHRLLEYVVPDFVHILKDGMIVKTGDKNLAHEIEKRGYEKVLVPKS